MIVPERGVSLACVILSAAQQHRAESKDPLFPIRNHRP